MVAGVGITLAFALTAGPWMALMFERYGNPLFPYFNDVFRSPWADPEQNLHPIARVPRPLPENVLEPLAGDAPAPPLRPTR